MSLAGEPEAAASLHEIRVEWRAGRSLGRVYRTPSGSLEARLASSGAALHRVVGPVTPDVAVSWDDLAALARAFTRWESVRDDWAAYFERGIVMADFAARLYWAPGRGSPQRTLGYGPSNGRPSSGLSFERSDETRALPVARTVAPGVEIVADLWRCEPSIGPREGERVGERWLIDGRLVVDARRLEARSAHGAASFRWLMWESEVPAALLALRRHVTQGAA